jgi:cation transport ATPase
VVARIDGEEITVGNWQSVSNNGGNGVGARSENYVAAVFVTRAGHLMTAIRVADTLRPEARATIEKLGEMVLKIILLTDDSRSVA